MIAQKRLVRLVSFIITVCICTTTLVCFAYADTPSLTSDASGTYLISDVQGMFSFAEIVAGGDTDANGRLVADIDLNPLTDVSLSASAPSVIWTPIQNFKGVFDGGGYTVSGVYYSDKAGENIGFFGSSSGTIKNLTLSDCYVYGEAYAGVICGSNQGEITNCNVIDGYLAARSMSLGLICGSNSGTVSACSVQGTVSDEGAAGRVGGVCGSNSGTIDRCTNNATVCATNLSNGDVGGICGYNTNKIYNCLNASPVSGASSNIGGICGYQSFTGQLKYCLNISEIPTAAGASCVGVVCGKNDSGKVNYCFFDSSVCNISAVGGGKTTSKYVSDTEGYDDLGSGQVAYLLNTDQSPCVWGQRLGVDEYPSPSNDCVVYLCKHYSGCNESSEYSAIYSNVNADVFGPHIDEIVDHKCDACGKAVDKIINVSLALGSEISVLYYAEISQSYSNPRMEFTLENCSPCIVDGVKQSDGTYMFKFERISPQCLGDNISAKLMADESDSIDMQTQYSVKQYCETVLGKTADYFGYSTEKYNAMCELVNNLLVYGGASQKFTNYKADALVSDGIDGVSYELPKASNRVMTDNGVHVTFTGANMVFNNASKLMFRFTATSIDGLTIKLTTSTSEVPIELEIEQLSEGVYTVSTPLIYASEYDKAFTVTAYCGEVAGACVTYDIPSYVYAMQDSESGNMVELAKAFYHYGVSAKKFLNSD